MNYELSNGYDTTRIMYIGCDELCIVQWVRYDTDNNTTLSSSPLTTTIIIKMPIDGRDNVE